MSVPESTQFHPGTPAHAAADARTRDVNQEVSPGTRSCALAQTITTSILAQVGAPKASRVRAWYRMGKPKVAEFLGIYPNRQVGAMNDFHATLRRSHVALSLALVAGLCSCGGGASPLPARDAAAAARQAHAGPSGPLRVSTMAYYEGNHENTGVPPSFMAANYDWAVQAANGGGAQYANAFHAAGGRHAVMYVDPNSRDCTSPKADTCTDAMLPNVNTLPESSWFHRAGTRKRIVRVYAFAQQRNDTADPQFQAMWTSTVAGLLNPSGGGSAAWAPANGGAALMDTMMWVNLATFTGGWGPMTGMTSDSQVIQYQQAVVAYTPANVLLQGVDYDYPQNGGYDQFLTGIAGNAIGATNRDAFAVDFGAGSRLDGYMTSYAPIPQAWQNQQNGIIDVVSRGLTDVVLMEGGADATHRLYGLASFWLTYDPARSVLWEDFCVPEGQPGCDSTWADGSVVPTEPTKTAKGNIASLASGQVYVREFAACYQNGTAIGACAAIVNPAKTHAAIPNLSLHYTKSIVLPAQTLYQGGAVTWSSSMPVTIGRHSAIILANAP